MRKQSKVKVKKAGTYVVRSGETRAGKVVARANGRAASIRSTNSDRLVVRALLDSRNG
jgi:hypothetical protein